MNLKLLITLLNVRRVPSYLSAIFFAHQNGILSLRKEIHGMITLPECVTLHKLASSLPRNSKILEIGCYGGLSTAYLLSGTTKNNASVYSIDPFASDMDRQKKIVRSYRNRYYKKVEYQSLSVKPSKVQVEKILSSLGYRNFKLLEGYSHDFLEDWKYKIDLLWIDGNHEYEYVKKDFLAWSKFLRKGGIVAFHDANKKEKSAFWKWGLVGPTKVVKRYLVPPKWIKKECVDSLVYATKNY